MAPFRKTDAAFSFLRFQSQLYKPAILPHLTRWNGSGTSSGWLVGGGIEYGFKPHWTVKLEYDTLTTGREAPPS